MNLRKTLSLILLSALILTACSGNALATPVNHKTPVVAPAATDEAPPFPPAITAARQALADMLGSQPEAIVVAGFAAVEWSDSCLNLGGAAELCAQAVTPGYRVILKAGDKDYIFHTDQTGEQVRQELAAALPQAAVKARQALAAELDLAHELLVSVLSVEEVEWPDSCLGVSQKDVMCAQVITPGYRVVLEYAGNRYEYHTSQTGDQIVKAPSLSLPSGSATPGLSWHSPGEPCERIEIDQRGAAFGACEGQLASGTLSDQRQSEWLDLLAAYAPFQAETPAGSIDFQGQGSLTATPAEQRAAAEWASLVAQELQSGRSSAEQGLALAWHREGGIAGFCDDLFVYAYGAALAMNCKVGQPQSVSLRLDAAQLEQLYTWLDDLQPIQDYQTDPATADAMTVELLLNGTGGRAAAEADRQALINFAMALYQQALK